jgi:GTPase involved in cell partitioning and DNA repair
VSVQKNTLNSLFPQLRSQSKAATPQKKTLFSPSTLQDSSYLFPLAIDSSTTKVYRITPLLKESLTNYISDLKDKAQQPVDNSRDVASMQHLSSDRQYQFQIKKHRLSVAAIYQKAKTKMQNDSAKIKISEHAQRKSESPKERFPVKTVP